MNLYVSMQYAKCRNEITELVISISILRSVVIFPS